MLSAGKVLLLSGLAQSIESRSLKLSTPAHRIGELPPGSARWATQGGLEGGLERRPRLRQQVAPEQGARRLRKGSRTIDACGDILFNYGPGFDVGFNDIGNEDFAYHK